MAKKGKGAKQTTVSKEIAKKPLADLLRLPAGPVDMAALDPLATPGYPGRGKADAPAFTTALAPELSDLQERLYATGRTADAGARTILIVLQGMDTSGKGGVIRHAIGMIDPQGVKIKAFKAPTEEERSHPYLWRIERELPPPGARSPRSTRWSRPSTDRRWERREPCWPSRARWDCSAPPWSIRRSLPDS